MVQVSVRTVGMAPLKRNVKFHGIEGDKELGIVRKKTTRCLNEVSRRVWRALRDGRIKILSSWYVDCDRDFLVEAGLSPANLKESEKNPGMFELTDTYFTRAMEGVFDELGCLKKDTRNIKRSLIHLVLNRYLGYFKRNKCCPGAPSRFHETKVMHFEDNSATVDVIRGLITLKTLYGKFTVKYRNRSRRPVGRDCVRDGSVLWVESSGVRPGMIAFSGDSWGLVREVRPGSVLLDRELGGSGEVFFDICKSNVNKKGACTYGGNLTYSAPTNSYCFVLVEEVPMETTYEPVGVLGFDINKTGSNWLVFSDGLVIAMSEEMSDRTERIRELNRLINTKNLPLDKRFTTGDMLRFVGLSGNWQGEVQLRKGIRRKLRKVWQREHRALRLICKKYAREIVDRCISERMIVAIDSVSSGAGSGTFGQEHLIDEITRICENGGIPHYVVPCRNTSRRCSECGYTDKENRKETDDFLCLKCGHAESSHLNAAKNIRDRASKYHSEGRTYGNYS